MSDTNQKKEDLSFLSPVFERALELARVGAAKGEIPVGAVVLRDGKNISEAYNRREELQSPSAHAEILALEAASKKLKSWRLDDCILITTLEPCVMCLGACFGARIRSVFFGAYDTKGGALSLGYKFNEDIRLNHNFDVTYFEMEECGRVLSEFFTQRRKEKL